MAEQVFDFSRVPLIAEDAVVKTVFEIEGEEFWIEQLVTPSGRRALWDWSDNWTAEEAIEWLAIAA
jgi:hypothetical protein